MQRSRDLLSEQYLRARISENVQQIGNYLLYLMLSTTIVYSEKIKSSNKIECIKVSRQRLKRMT